MCVCVCVCVCVRGRERRNRRRVWTDESRIPSSYKLEHSAVLLWCVGCVCVCVAPGVRTVKPSSYKLEHSAVLFFLLCVCELVFCVCVFLGVFVGVCE